MDILTAIKNRRSIAKVTSEDIPNDLIEQIIKAGCYAPAHKRTDPWRFNVFKGAGRKHIQNAIEKHLSINEHDEVERERKLIKIQNKAYRAPVIIAVWCAIARTKNDLPQWEEEVAVAVCLQNMSLATHALGLGSIWRTGNFVDIPEIQKLCKTDYETFDATKGDKIMGFLYIGYPDTQKSTPTRTIDGWQNKISWITE